MRSTHNFWLVVLSFTLFLPSQSIVAQVVIATLPIGSNSLGLPVGIAVNPVTNKTYVANNSCSSSNSCTNPGTVTIIDGATNLATTVNVGVYPTTVAVNAVTNRIYVPNYCGNDLLCQSAGTVTMIDASNNNNITTIHTDFNPYGVAVNPTTNKIYVSNYCGKNDMLHDCMNAGTVTVIDGITNTVTATVPVEVKPSGIAVNPNTNKIYVANVCGSDITCNSTGTVTVIDGNNNNSTTTVNVGFFPYPSGKILSLAVNSMTNQVYVPNCGSDIYCLTPGAVTVIDGANNTTDIAMPAVPYDVAVNETTNKIYVSNNSPGMVAFIDGALGRIIQVVNVGLVAHGLAVDSATNEIYVVNPCGSDPYCQSPGTVAVINGGTYSQGLVAVGDGPESVAINETTDRIYVPNNIDNSTSVIAGDTGLQFVPITPCRLVDTRNANGPFGGPPIPGGTFRSFPIPQQGSCNIPASAASYSLNVTLIPIQRGRVGYLTIWPAGERQPTISTMNSLDGRIKANAAILPAGVSGGVSVYVNNTTNIAIDIDGYFIPTSSSTLAFYPLKPCRVLDTRNPNGALGGPFLSGGQERDFPLLESSCLPPGVNPQAYSLNFTVVPYNQQPLGFLTVWAAGQSQPVVSTLNNLTATIVANAAIVPAGTGGQIATYPSANTQLLADINGYFAAAGQGGLSLYPAVPCRVIDTRQGSGAFSGELTVNVAGSLCAPPSTAQAYVFNATVLPQGALGFLTLWPDGQGQPVVSTLNAVDGAVTSNMAIVPNLNGFTDAYASALTQLILDISSYFAP